jgi:radical SAM superfamily enzyme YgiQ (UPF0313 family)
MIKEKINVLMVYPEIPKTFWGFQYAFKFIFKKATYSPLGLLTIASLLPRNWELKLIDLNVERLKDKHLSWADLVFISAMTIQSHSTRKIIERCKKAGVKIVAGGPLFSASYGELKDVDHFVLNEGEITFPLFLDDWENGRPLKNVYSTTAFPDITKSPVPRWDLANMKKYLSVTIQYSRGCPFSCEFCEIKSLFGSAIRTKTSQQIVGELDSLYLTGWKRGNVFFVDDNFIGNKTKLKNDVLHAIIAWQKKRGYPFTFSTEASIDLADDDELMTLMAEAGFTMVFIGIETPSEEGLTGCNKLQNTGRNLVDSIKKIQKFGMEVTGGFIVGFDTDTPSIFQRQIDFIKESGIILAMVGLLNAPKNTLLYKRLQKEGRLLQDMTGDNTDCSINFLPKMNSQVLKDGYREIIKKIYSAKPYYERILAFIKEKQKIKRHFRFNFEIAHIKALVAAVLILGIAEKGRTFFWKSFFWSLFNRPKKFPLFLTFAIEGYHIRKIFRV